MSNELFRLLPPIDLLLSRPVALELSEGLGRDRVRDLLREVTDEVRGEIFKGAWQGERGNGAGDHLLAEIERRVKLRANLLMHPSLKRVINATGVIVHTNLGRAPLARAAIEAVAALSAGYSNLEYDLNEGARGHRETHCSELLSRLIGSESAVVTNNNAAAVLLVLNSLAEGGEVIVSRGELIEIGGSFRIPDVMEKSGARLREVGTTNRTRIGDYERAINEKTRLILRVHPSNYRIVGFTERPSSREIAELASRYNLPSFEDLGSGNFIDLGRYGIKDEPVVSDSLGAGISVVSFSGDKLLGGPQAGIIAGSKTILDRVRTNPLMRVLRVDKMTYAALEATLRLYERGVAESEVPIVRAMQLSRDEIHKRAEVLRERLVNAAGGDVSAEIEDGSSVIGGGAAPEMPLPTALIAITHTRFSAASLDELLRTGGTPIVARTERDRLLLDLRTVAPEEEAAIVDAFAALRSQASMTSTATEIDEQPALVRDPAATAG
ncbi:MAG TPA: L-seryl-tRNA(Sec) selenium transferase [Blastocatellia bacterium]|jgi:L-seryl-tRNA(Ser) seleniumtransferase|nr:L-seryl-tRNA(Sec) selenium transferase [Blastocatellia bacterium]